MTVKGGFKKIFMYVWGAFRTRSLGVAPRGLKKKEGERAVVTTGVSIANERERYRKRQGTSVTSHHSLLFTLTAGRCHALI